MLRHYTGPVMFSITTAVVPVPCHFGRGEQYLNFMRGNEVVNRLTASELTRHNTSKPYSPPPPRSTSAVGNSNRAKWIGIPVGREGGGGVGLKVRQGDVRCAGTAWRHIAATHSSQPFWGRTRRGRSQRLVFVSFLSYSSFLPWVFQWPVGFLTCPLINWNRRRERKQRSSISYTNGKKNQSETKK